MSILTNKIVDEDLYLYPLGCLEDDPSLCLLMHQEINVALDSFTHQAKFYISSIFDFSSSISEYFPLISSHIAIISPSLRSALSE
jgi:hypothetical protein